MKTLTISRRIGPAPTWAAKMVAASLVLACCLSLFGCRRPRDPQLVTVVSLKALQNTLAACQAKGSCPNQLEKLSGITRLLGFVVDEKNHDLLLIGRAEAGAPPLHLEDFVVALRAAWMRYAQIEGNTYTYSNPGCSIDPDPAVIGQLNAVGRRIASASSANGVETAIDAWRATCKQPQKVRVLGVPFDSHFAQVMVSADYDMKTLADGTAETKIPGLIGVSDMMLETEKEAAAARQPISVSPNLNRFWFYPGPSVYDESSGVVFIRQCPVELLTEQMHAVGGKIVGDQSVDPFADAFRHNVTALYDELGRARPIYRELENMFRFVAVATAIKTKYPEAANLDYLLDRYQAPPDTQVDRTVAGRDGVKKYAETKMSGALTESVSLWVPSCGGVDIAISNPDFVSDRSGLLDRFASSILERRDLSPVAWSYQDQSGFVNKYETTDNELARPDGAMVVRVVSVPSGYQIYGSNGEVSFVRDAPAAVAYLRQRLSANVSGVLFAFLEDFPTAAKEIAFHETLARHLSASFTGITVARLSATHEGDVFASGQLVDEARQIQRVETGRFESLYQVTLNFVARVHGILVRVTAHVYAASYEIALRIDEKLADYLKQRRFHTMSAAEVAVFIQKEVKKEHPDENLKMEFEFDHTYITTLTNPLKKGWNPTARHEVSGDQETNPIQW